MKCDELKAEQWLDYAGEPRPCYPKSEADKVISHQKYKRCLAMAKWCEAELFAYPPFGTESPKEKWWQKWRNRWLELAEKFKEAK